MSDAILKIDWGRVWFYNARAGSPEHIVVGHTLWTLCGKSRGSMRRLVPHALCERLSRLPRHEIPWSEAKQKELATELVRCKSCAAEFAAHRLIGDLPHDDY